VGDSRPRREERRKSPRFSVGGWATVHCLPLEGKPIPALVRNLSAGGVCLDVRHVLELGTRTEVLLCVNSEIFRAAALVREQREASSACFEFVEISRGAKSILQDLIERLARQQTLTRKLRSAGIDEGMKQMLLDTGRFRLLAVAADQPSIADADIVVERPACTIAPATAEDRKIIQLKPGLIEIDLFG